MELYESSKAYFLPYIERFVSVSEGFRVLEIGCGEGGNLLPFAELGCVVTGMDLAEKKIENARAFFEERGQSGSFFRDNVINSTLYLEQNQFDLILVHDVIEHIEPEDKMVFFSQLKLYLKKGGAVFWGFPAWQMPYGGHQQTCGKGFCSKIPFVHLMPMGLYKAYLRLFGVNDSHINELASIKRSKMTTESFEALCAEEGYRVIDRTLWFINPHYKAKFGLTPIKLSRFLSRVPRLRNFLSTSCFYFTVPE